MSKKGLLAGLIFKDEPVTEQKEQAPAQQVAAPTSTPKIASQGTIQGVADNKFIQMLEEVIAQNNIPGQDYFEFKQAIENMGSIVMDDKTKFLTVYNVLSLQGCNKDVLLSSLDKYVQIIQLEKENFTKEMQAEYSVRVQSKVDEVERAKKELETITKRMADINNTILQLSQEAQAEDMKLRATEANFMASADIIMNEMINDKQKITNFIQ